MRPSTSNSSTKTKSETRKLNGKKIEENIDQVNQANQPSEFNKVNESQIENGDDVNMVNSLVFSNSDFDEEEVDNAEGSDLEDFDSKDIIDDKQWDTDIEDESGKLN